MMPMSDCERTRTFRCGSLRFRSGGLAGPAATCAELQWRDSHAMINGGDELMNNYATNENKRHSKTTKKRSKASPDASTVPAIPACLIYAQPIILLRIRKFELVNVRCQPAGGPYPNRLDLARLEFVLDTVRSPRSRIGSPIEK